MFAAPLTALRFVGIIITDYFVIGFRIFLPVFSCILVINIVLGILARIAPQMNMFVIGMQLKIFVGLVVLYFVMNLLPGLCDFIFQEMQDLSCLLYTSPSPRDVEESRMPSSA